MYLNDYQKHALEYAIYPRENAIHYTMHGLTSEVGEVADKVKKSMRDGWAPLMLREEVKKELGDVLWYVAAMAREFDLNLMDIAVGNIAKLNDRKLRGKITGSGDGR